MDEHAKYIAFEGTYNEQIYDAAERTVTWHDGAKIENVRVLTEDDGVAEPWRNLSSEAVE